MSLIEEARISRESTRQKAEEQVKADLLCQTMRYDCEDLLVRGGERVKNWWRRVLIIPCFPFTLPMSAALRVYPFDYTDNMELQRSVNGSGEPIKVTLSSEFANVQRSRWIDINVEGLSTFLSLFKANGGIFFQDYSVRTWDRRANLQDAQQYREIVDLLK